MPPNARANRYDHTPRKVFDKAMDRMDLKRRRDRDDTNADYRILQRQLKELNLEMANLHEELEELQHHVDRHCQQLDTARDTEGLE